MRGSRKIFQSTVGVVNVWGGKIKVAGEIIAFAGSIIPSGFLVANGALVSRASYANLFAAIGVSYGAGDGLNTFGLPDLRGEFIRGLDGGRGVDSARMSGSGQSDSLQDHSHSIRVRSDSLAMPGSGGNDIPQGVVSGGASGIADQFGVESINVGRVSAETRPRNIAMPYLIQY